MMKKVKRKQRKNGRAMLFGKVLLSVLIVGGIGLVWLCAMAQEEMSVVRQFFKLPELAKEEQWEKGDWNENGIVTELNADEVIYAEMTKYTSKVKKIVCEDDEVVKLVIGGDVLLDDEYAMMATYRNKGSKLENAFSEDLIEYMRSADVFVVNNEFTFTNRGMPTEGKKFTFRAEPADVSFYNDIGVDAVSLANNHAYDYGEISLLDTLDTLENADIAYVGAGRNLEEAMQPYYFVANGIKIAVVAATQIERLNVPDTKEATETAPGVLRCLDTERILQVIDTAKGYADYVVLYVHWGTENQQEIDWWQAEQVRVFAESGVDVIVGNHPHCLQKIEYVSDVPVVYSLGNFWFNSKTVETGLLEITFSREKIQSLRFVPCLQSECKTVMLQGETKQSVLNTLRMISPDIWIDTEGYISLESK